MKSLATCGCGEHQVRVGVKNTILWRGKYWDARCAFEESTKEISLLEKRVQQVPENLKVLVEKLPCADCERPVGKNHVLLGDNVYHATCLYDIGGG